MAWEKFRYATTDVVMPAKICVIDEYASFVNVTDRKDMRLVDQLTSNIEKIAALGRSAHIHIVIATQSPTGNLFPTSLKNNISERIICGRVESNISQLAIGNDAGESLPLTPGTYLGYSKDMIQRFQGYFTNISDVLALGTVKPGFDPKTGQPLNEFDPSKPIEDYELEESSPAEEEPMEEIAIGDTGGESNDDNDSFDFNSFLGIDEDGEFTKKEETPTVAENPTSSGVAGAVEDTFDDIDMSLLGDLEDPVSPASEEDLGLGEITSETMEEEAKTTFEVNITPTPKVKINIGAKKPSTSVSVAPTPAPAATSSANSNSPVKIKIGGVKKQEKTDDDPYGIEDIKKNRDKYSGGSVILE